ncbi:Elongin-A [Coemansia sp. RSA 1933]|nr:Elongin-A [Coemansia sp. RSA 1933]
MAADTPGSTRIPALTTLCQRAIVANFQRIRYLGAVPQFLVSEALAQCTAEQLEAIESWNPHIIDDNEPLWAMHCTLKYKALKDLHDNIANGTALPETTSWRTLYHDMKRQDEIRAQEIMGRVREKTAALERERNSRKIQIARVTAREPRNGWRPVDMQMRQRAAGASLLQRARQETKAHISMLGGSRSRNSTYARPKAVSPKAVKSNPVRPSRPAQNSLPQPVQNSLPQPVQMLPSGSPEQSPPYHASTYSPPYFSLAPSCSPAHSAYSPPSQYSAYSPPYVPEFAGNTENNSSDTHSTFNIFEDAFGVSAATAYATLSSTVVIKEQTRKRRRPRRESRSDMEHHLPKK